MGAGKLARPTVWCMFPVVILGQRARASVLLLCFLLDFQAAVADRASARETRTEPEQPEQTGLGSGPSEDLNAGTQLLVPWRLFEGDVTDTRIAQDNLVEAVDDLSRSLQGLRSQSEDDAKRAHMRRTMQRNLSHAVSSSAQNLRGRVDRAASKANAKEEELDDQDEQAQPVLNFLFLSMERMAHSDLWKSFFSRAQQGTWRAFLHCKMRSNCSSALQLRNPLGLILVPTVPSSYCHDLVSPMVQLLRSALAHSTSPRDKFVFLSDTTLPLKPFQSIYHELTKLRGSDLCIVPRNFWPILETSHQEFAADIVKHSQWVVLNRWHAKRMVWRWNAVSRSRLSHWSVPVWPEARQKSYTIEDFGKLAPNSVPLCTDEWAIFATLFGAILRRPNQADETLPGYSTNPLDLASYRTLHESQGWCRTFWWHEGVKKDFDFAFVAKAVSPFLSCYMDCHTQGSHPAEFWAISDHALSVLRDSSFLFARKFPEDIVSLDQFVRIILKEEKEERSWNVA